MSNSSVGKPTGGVDTRPVFGYVRVSTNRQETERQEQTIPGRHASLPDGLDSNALELFYDQGISAWSGKPRPAFDEMFERIRQGEASALIIDTSSRLTRQGIRHALTIFFQLQDSNCRLFTTEGREYTFSLGDIISLIVDAEGDERYSANLSHNIESGKAAKAREGRWHHGDVGPGLRFDKESGQLVATADLPTIAEAFRRFNAGETYNRICAYLNTHLSADALARYKSGQVTRDRLRAWLANPIYAGFIPRRGELHQGTHPAAVDLATFEKAQRRLRKLATEPVRQPRAWPFSGIAKCGHCRRSLRLHPVKNRYGTRYYYTRCANEECSRANKAYTAAAMEGNVVESLAAIAVVLETILLNDPSYGIPREGGPTLEDVQATLAAAQARLKKLGRLIATDALDENDPEYLAAQHERDSAQAAFDRIASRTRDHRDELAELAARILSLGEDVTLPRWEEEAISREPVAIDESGRDVTGESTLRRILAGWQYADFDRQREVIEKTLEAVYISPDHAEFHFRVGLPTSLIQNLIVQVHGRSESTPELEAAGYGRPFDAATKEVWANAGQQ